MCETEWKSKVELGKSAVKVFLSTAVVKIRAVFFSGDDMSDTSNAKTSKCHSLRLLHTETVSKLKYQVRKPTKESKNENSYFFLICRRARRQRSQSPILVTVRIDKHFKLYIDWSLSGKSKSSQLASHVMESTSRFLLIAQSAIRKAATLQSSYSRTATTHDCKNMQMKSQHWVAPNCTCRRAFNCKQPQCSNCIRLTS